MDGLKTIRHFVALIGFADSKRKNPPVLTDRLGAFALMGVVEQYEGSLAKLSLEEVKAKRSEFPAELEKYGVALVGATETTSVPTAKISTQPVWVDRYVNLKGIGQKDFVVFINLGPDAPHAYRDLSGDIKFENSQIVRCSPTLKKISLPKQVYVADQIKENLVENFTVDLKTKCSKGLDGIDALLVTGEDLGKPVQIPPLDVLDKAVADGTLSRLIDITWKNYEKAQMKAEMVSEQYATDVASGARIGFGAVAFDNQSGMACIVLDETENKEAHSASIQEMTMSYMTLIGKEISDRIETNVNNAFKFAQKQQCALIYAHSSDLRTLLEAAANANLKTKVLSKWVTESIIETRINELQKSQSQNASEEAERLNALKQQQIQDLEKKRWRWNNLSLGRSNSEIRTEPRSNP